MAQFFDHIDDGIALAHPIFRRIRRGRLEAVQHRVLADAAVLDRRAGNNMGTPLMFAISWDEPEIALWSIEHRGPHDVDSADDDGWTAL